MSNERGAGRHHGEAAARHLRDPPGAVLRHRRELGREHRVDLAAAGIEQLERPRVVEGQPVPVGGVTACAVPALAVELRPLRVNAVSPGVVDTPWWDALPADQRAAALASYADKAPVGRVGAPDDIAKTIAYLIDNTFMTGQTVICDGGLSLV